MVEEKDIDELVEEKVIADLTPIDEEEVYNDMLDECYGDVDVAGFSYQTSRLLKEVDPIAYRCGMNDYFGCDEDTYIEIDGNIYYKEEVDDIRTEIEEE